MSSDVETVQSRVQTLLTELFTVKGARFDPQQPLRSQDFDSLDTVALLSHLEQTFGVAMQDDDLVDENFRDLDSIARLMARKCPAG
jgi:acyl carrier protein